VYFDRRIHEPFLDLLHAGFLQPLVERWRQGRPLYDLLLWASPKTSYSSVSFYYGLTSLLDVEFGPKAGGDVLRLRAHRTHRVAGEFDRTWAQWRPAEELARDWPDVERYLTNMTASPVPPGLPLVDPRWTGTEGAVHGALCAGLSHAYRTIGREASVGFRDRATQEKIIKELSNPIINASLSLQSVQPWLRPKPLGTGADLLATDSAGRLLVIEAKWYRAAGGVAWAPAQVRLYAELVARWVEVASTPVAAKILNDMLGQRETLGLGAPGGSPPLATPTVVPVVAVGDQPPSKEVQRRLWVVADALAETPTLSPLVAPLEVWFLDKDGHPTEVRSPTS
jgi:hypothetical protein